MGLDQSRMGWKRLLVLVVNLVEARCLDFQVGMAVLVGSPDESYRFMVAASDLLPLVGADSAIQLSMHQSFSNGNLLI